MTKLHDRIDLMLSAHYASAMINRYLLWRFDCIGAIAVFITTVISLRSSHSAGTTALAITSAQGLCSSIYWLCRFVSALEVDLNGASDSAAVGFEARSEPLFHDLRYSGGTNYRATRNATRAEYVDLVGRRQESTRDLADRHSWDLGQKSYSRLLPFPSSCFAQRFVRFAPSREGCSGR